MKTLTKIGLTGLLVASLGIGAAQAIPPAPRVAPVARVRGPIVNRPYFAPRTYWGAGYYAPGVSVGFYGPGYAYYNPGYVPAPAPGVAIDFGYAPGPYYFGAGYYPYGYAWPGPGYRAFPRGPYRAGFAHGPFRGAAYRGVAGPRALAPRALPHR
jgi:hypothetical protein